MTVAHFSLNEVPTDNIFDVYAQWTDTVAKYPPTAEPFYLALGIADEAGELIGAQNGIDTLKEAGDVMWYCARYCTKVLKVDFGVAVEGMRNQSWCDNPTRSIGTICGIEKKRIRDGADWDEMKVRAKHEVAYESLLNVLVWVHVLLARFGYTMSDAIDANRVKLSKRLDEGTIQGDGDNR